MDKKVLSLAVAGIIAAPFAACAGEDSTLQAGKDSRSGNGPGSSLQLFGAANVEYSFSNSRGQLGSATGAPAGQLVPIDMLQTPDSELGFKGEEALGGGVSAWFQCASTMDVRGSGTGTAAGFCTRNSAVGIKGTFGNLYVGNWDTPLKKTAPEARIVNSIGIWGASFLLFGNATSTNDNAQPTTWARRQNNSIFYDTPVWRGVQVFTAMSTPSTAASATTTLSGSKPRLYSIAANYINGPLLVTAGYEIHKDFKPGAPVNGNYSGTDNGYQIGAHYRFGPVKAGVIYTKQKMNMGSGTSGQVSAWGVAGQWELGGPHAIRAGYDRANSTAGNFVAGPGSTLLPQSDNRVFNGGLGNTGGSLSQIQYVFHASKRTEVTAGIAVLHNDSNARYSLGGYTSAPAAGQDQRAIAIGMRQVF